VRISLGNTGNSRDGSEIQDRYTESGYREIQEKQRDLVEIEGDLE
jgi:hypothetical protein